MAYITQSDIEKQLPAATLVQLTDDDEDGTADAAVVADIIAKAEAEVNSYLQERYTIPLSPVPELVKSLTVTVSIWKAFVRRQRANDVAEKEYENAVRLLKALSKGDASLGMENPPAETGIDEVETTRSASDRVFTRGDSDTSGSLDNF